MSKEAMQLALEALEKVITAFGSGLTLTERYHRPAQSTRDRARASFVAENLV
jgi:hypothetical protein